MPRCTIAAIAIAALFAPDLLAHPASSIVVTEKGEVLFVHTGHGLARIEADGKLTYLHKDTGGHWLALDAEGKFAAAADTRLFKRVKPLGDKPILLFASGRAPFVVNRHGSSDSGSSS